MPTSFNKRFTPPIFWAGLVGFLLGILFSATIWSTNRIFQIRESILDENGTTTNHIGLNITSPPTGTVVSSDAITLKGSTTKPAILVFSGGAQDAVLDPGNTKFQTSYKLQEGENEIQVTAVDGDGNEASTTLNVLYSTSNLQ